MAFSLLASITLASLASAGVAGSAGYSQGWPSRALRHDWDKYVRNSTLESCYGGAAPTTTAPKPNPWSPISAADNLAVWNLLHDPVTGLNLTDPDNATLTDNYVGWIDTIHLDKVDALSFIDDDGAMPPKYARVVIFEGGKLEPDSQEYMVGPLPVSAATAVQPYDHIFNGGRGGSVPYNARYFDGPRSAATDPLIAETMGNISDITAALFQGGVYFGASDNRTNMTVTSGTPLSFDGTQAFRNIMFRFPGPATYMTPLDFFLLIDCTGTDATLYSVKGFVTKETFYQTEAELRAAYEAGELTHEFEQDRDYSWALLDLKPELGQFVVIAHVFDNLLTQAAGTRDLEDRLAPTSVELGGKRYRVDAEEQYVEYMGWSFYLSFSRTLGIMFYDIRFKGERILYELSLQEATAQYGGNQPKAANTVYHDTYYSLGTDMGQLVEGFDCPFGVSALLHVRSFEHRADCLFSLPSGTSLTTMPTPLSPTSIHCASTKQTWAIRCPVIVPLEVRATTASRT